MAGIYRQRHPERTVFYRVLFHYFDEFVAEYENRFEREYGYFRPVIQEVVEKYLDCGNPKCGFARIRCRDCGSEFLLHFSCHGRGFCPSCHAKRREEWGEWMREELLLDVPHHQVVFTIPKMLRVFFKYNRSLLSGLCLCGKETLLKYFKAATGKELTPGIIAVIQSFGSRINLHQHLHFLVSEGGSDQEGRFHGICRFNDDLLREIFSKLERMDYLEFIARVTFEAYFFAFFVVLFLCFILDLIFFHVICSFQDVSEWKLRRIARDLPQAQKRNSYRF